MNLYHPYSPKEADFMTSYLVMKGHTISVEWMDKGEVSQTLTSTHLSRWNLSVQWFIEALWGFPTSLDTQSNKGLSSKWHTGWLCLCHNFNSTISKWHFNSHVGWFGSVFIPVILNAVPGMNTHTSVWRCYFVRICYFVKMTFYFQLHDKELEQKLIEMLLLLNLNI